MLTVFTPTYNRAHTLPRLYESLLAQDCKDFEWLVIDDGSEDGTKALFDKWEAQDVINKKGHHPVGIEDMDACVGCASCAMMCPDCVIKVEKDA